jgi:hypothetical protein
MQIVTITLQNELLTLATIAVKKHIERLNQLYEKQSIKKATSKEMALVLGHYVKRWLCWCRRFG